MFSLSPSPAAAHAGLILTSHRVGVSSYLGAGNWLARIRFCVARQLFSCTPDGLDRGDHGPARSVILKSLHADGCESGLGASHGANRRVVRHG